QDPAAQDQYLCALCWNFVVSLVVVFDFKPVYCDGQSRDRICQPARKAGFSPTAIGYREGQAGDDRLAISVFQSCTRNTKGSGGPQFPENQGLDCIFQPAGVYQPAVSARAARDIC